MVAARQPNDRLSSREIFPALAIALCGIAWGACCGGASAPPKAAPRASVPAGATSAASPACGTDIPGQEQLAASVVVLGETHGTAEIPAAFRDLVCHAARRRGDATILVGVEIPSDEQAAIDRFLESDGGPDARSALLQGGFWHREYQDGRSSASRLDLLEALRGDRAAGMKIAVRAIDVVRSESQAGRDAGMAAAVVDAMRAVRPAQTLILIGDVHSRILKGYPWEPSADYMPMGAILRATYPDAIGLNVTSPGGTAWTCQSAVALECGVKSLRAREVPGPTPRIMLEPEALDRKGWSGTLVLGALTASPPALHALK